MTKRLFDSAADVEQMSERNRSSRVKKAAAQVTERGEQSLSGCRNSGAPPAAAAPIRKRKKFTDYNAMLGNQLSLANITDLDSTGNVWREYQFNNKRKWRLDFAWPVISLALEIDGAVHRIKGRWEKSFEREQALFFSGWRLLKVSTKQVRSGEAVQLIERALSMMKGA